MFTLATKKFGVWREERAITVISYKLMSRQFLFSLAIAAFISWTIFIISLKIREEFFLFESASKAYSSLDKIKKLQKGFFVRERKSAITIYLSHEQETNNLRIIFENGKSFILPKDGQKFLDYFEDKRKNIMLTALLIRVPDPAISRVKIWSDRTISFQDLKYIMRVFSQFGYDDFDIAVER
ncbi:hypothetical protein QEJ31_06565 [Pigmentibacter sp. JX0631]|uniref:hypothetical protein n=1 Tax=Pigmentibacter sp. JX0631 TaxID=2976982 RepID=UPI00246891B3|nr:hypothetical protein [Pigmentibacter sp. JX0631]WGL61253.1 hypothetical protein QEJ31_06565 [Pigmentibacter sp. JX0631]